MQKDFGVALHYYDRAVEIYEKLYGRDHALVQDTIANRDLAAENCRH